MPARRTIAIVDDNELVLKSMAGLIRSLGFDTLTFGSGAALLSAVARFDCVISDVQMPGMSGIELRRILAERMPTLPVIMITAYPERAQGVVSDGALCLLEKPIDTDRLLAVLRQIFEFN